MSKRKQTKRKLSRRRKRKEELRQTRSALGVEIAEERALVAKVRSKRRIALDKGNEKRAEELADKIEAVRAKIARLKDREESIEARLLKVSAIAKRLRKKLRRLRQKARRKKHYASKHFRYDEFDCRDGTPVPESAKPALRHLCKNYLEPLRGRYGAVYVNSGYRTRTYNASIGGASQSEHIYDETPDGVAADHVCQSASPATVADFHDARNVGGLGRYSTFTHIDNRDRDGKAHARWWG